MKKYFQAYLNIISKLFPDKPKGTSVALDIGAGDCKMVELDKTEEGFELINWGIEPIVNNDVKATIQKLFKKLERSCKSVYTSVFGKGTLIRYIDMPQMSIEDLRNSFAIEADKHFPFSQDEIYTDCYILSNQEKGRQMRVMAAAAKKSMIDQRIKMLEELGLQTDFIGINPVALVNVYNVLGEEEKKTDRSGIAMLDMGASVSCLNIVINKVPWFTRDIFIGGDDLTKRISNALGISMKEAEQLKRNPQQKLTEILSACESAILNIVQELRLSFDYFATEKNVDITKLLLTGGGCMLEGLGKSFEKHLEIDVGIWNPLQSIKISEDVTGDINAKALQLGVALGLALYDYD